MKYLLTVALIFVSIFGYSQSVKEGDNLKVLFRNLTNPNFKAAPTVTYWLEGEGIFFIGSKQKSTEEFVFMALKDTTLFGVFTVKGDNKFVFDTAGNSTLSLTSHVFTLPYWVVKRKAKISSTDKSILKLMDKLYESTLQANDGQLDMNTARKFNQYRTDTTLANRHIAFLLDNYQLLISNSAKMGQRPPANISVPLMRNLTNECLTTFGKVPVLVCIYMGEALLSADIESEAKEHFKKSLELYPNSVPLLVYNYRLEQDTAIKNELLQKLKKEHHKHWMVKDL